MVAIRWAGYAVFTAIFLLAIWRGGSTERVSALGMLAAMVATPLVQNLQDWVSPQYQVMVVDFLLMAVFMWLALRSNRYWPMFAAAFQLVLLVGHGAMAADPSIGSRAYITAEILWSYMTLFPLLWGTVGAMRARRAGLSV